MLTLDQLHLILDRFRKQFRFIIGFAITTEILLLTPSTVDSWSISTSAIELDPDDIAAAYEQDNVAFGLDRKKIPEYSAADFDYTSAKGGQRQWKLQAKRAYMYNSERLVLARTVESQIFDEEGKITVITGDRARYYMNKKDLEVFGSVKTRFPDGFTIQSEYVKYYPDQKRVEVPVTEPTQGQGTLEGDKTVFFNSMGFIFKMKEDSILLPRDVHFRIEPKNAREKTSIESDYCHINRNTKIAEFEMQPWRPVEERYIQIRQPTIYVKARRGRLDYGFSESAKSVEYLYAYDDVFLQEKGNPETSRYGTAGKAAFENKRNVVILTELPQLYQNGDTIAGDRIIMHRDSDIVEVEKSNAFNEGEKEHP